MHATHGSHIAARAYHKYFTLLGHHIVLQTLDDCGASLGQAHHIVVALIQVGRSVQQDVAIGIGRGIIIEARPGAYICPSKMSLLYEDLVAALEDAHIHTQIGQRREELGHKARIGTLCFGHHAGYLHLILGHELV